MNIFTKFLAFICRICPFCVFARRFPDSKFTRTMKAAERSCPCCKAYAKLHS